MNEIRFITSKDLPEEAHLEVSENLHFISKENPAMLERSIRHYSHLLQENLIVIAYNGSSIIGSGGLLPLNDKWGELSGIHVEPEYSHQKIGDSIVKNVKLLASQKGMNSLLTMKPNQKGSSGMIVIALRNGYIPLSFKYLLELDFDAYKNCCVCKDDSGSLGCKYQDTECILGVEYDGTKSMKNHLISYINSVNFNEAVKDSKLKETIIQILSPLIQK